MGPIQEALASAPFSSKKLGVGLGPENISEAADRYGSLGTKQVWDLTFLWCQELMGVRETRWKAGEKVCLGSVRRIVCS